jgi:hypothetical protein
MVLKLKKHREDEVVEAPLPAYVEIQKFDTKCFLKIGLVVVIAVVQICIFVVYVVYYKGIS